MHNRQHETAKERNMTRNRLLACTALGLLLGLSPALAEDKAADQPIVAPAAPGSEAPMKMQPGTGTEAPADIAPVPGPRSEAPEAMPPDAIPPKSAALPDSPKFVETQKRNDWLASS